MTAWRSYLIFRKCWCLILGRLRACSPCNSQDSVKSEESYIGIHVMLHNAGARHGVSPFFPLSLPGHLCGRINEKGSVHVLLIFPACHDVA
jgi:hypothetical protein